MSEPSMYRVVYVEPGKPAVEKRIGTKLEDLQAEVGGLIECICWPSIPTISKDLKLSESTTRRALADLRKTGLVQTEQRYRENGGNSSLIYQLE